MTTTDLVRQVAFKKTGFQNNQLLQLLANIISKINPHRHEVDGAIYLSLKDESKSARDGPDWDEPLRDELAKDAWAVLEGMVLVENDFNPLREKPAGSKDPPDLCRSKDEMRSCRLLTGTARDMLAPNEDAPAEGTAPAGDGKAAAGGKTDEMELLKEAAKEGPAADESIEPVIPKSVGLDINENAVHETPPRTPLLTTT